MTLRALLLVLSTLAGLCAASANEPLPNQIAVGVEKRRWRADFKRLVAAAAAAIGAEERLTPDNPAFRGAEVWFIDTPERDAEKAAQQSFAQAGMTGVNVVAAARGNPEAVKVLDSDPSAPGRFGNGGGAHRRPNRRAESRSLFMGRRTKPRGQAAFTVSWRRRRSSRRSAATPSPLCAGSMRPPSPETICVKTEQWPRTKPSRASTPFCDMGRGLPHPHDGHADANADADHSNDARAGITP